MLGLTTWQPRPESDYIPPGPKVAIAYYFTEYRNTATTLLGYHLAWLNEQRRQALTAFMKQGLPKTHQENWKYTDVSSIQEHAFHLSEKVTLDHTAIPWQKTLVTDNTNAPRFVFLNGYFAPELSQPYHLPEGTILKPLSTAIVEDEPLLQAHWEKVNEYAGKSFAALNFTFFQDGILLVLPPHTTLHDPIQLVFITTSQETIITHPHNVIIAGENSRVTICESYIGIDTHHYFTNAAIDIIAKKNSHIDYIKLQQENDLSLHIAHQHVQQEAGSEFHSHVYSLGGKLSRHEIQVNLAGENAQCTLNGLYLASKQQHSDQTIEIHHVKPRTNSHEYYKGVLDQTGKGVFNGKIVVYPHAQKVDAKQTNKNLLLSESATIDTKPQLAIYADDVKCAHGATVGQLDEEALFYLRSRGIDHETARRLLTFAFANDVIERMPIPTLQTHLQQIVKEII